MDKLENTRMDDIEEDEGRVKPLCGTGRETTSPRNETLASHRVESRGSKVSFDADQYL